MRHNNLLNHAMVSITAICDEEVLLKVVNWPRNDFYKILAAAFSSLGNQPRLAELGVLRGENAWSCTKPCSQVT